MNANTLQSLRAPCVFLALIALLAVVPASRGQTKSTDDRGIVEGTVCDSQNKPVANAAISLESDGQSRKFVAHSDAQGRYRFEALPPGSYTLHANKPGYLDKSEGPFAVQQKEVKSVALKLLPSEPSASSKNALSSLEFSEEPHFNVSGVTDPTNLGGHGSDTVLRTKEALAKDTAALNHEEPAQPNNISGAAESTADAHVRLGDAAEREGRPLEAVQEYQRAAELQPSEPHLFVWGAELLLHRAFEPAIEVFTKGHRLYPDSARMLLGLSVATYDQGATKRGVQLLLEACDLNPSDPAPYMFLGKLQQAEKIEPPGWTEKFKRFANLHPENAMAHYYYAVALSKQSPGTEDFALVESELKRAIELDPKLGNAYLQLGILYSSKKDAPAAIRAFQKAIELLPLPDEAHYRLAQLYRQSGESEKARQEKALYDQTAQQKTKEAEQQRHEIQQFVYTLRGQNPSQPVPTAKPQ
jgi:tetratricopeptide (TPR) repeat protein